ncbi:MAG: hypothetical protein ABI286_03405 [Edaphobacter sp.]
MKLSPIPCHCRPQRWFLAGAAAVVIACAVGCASPGPPRPPSLNLPEVVTDLSADRAGDVVELHWTTPEKTTDRLNIKDAMTAEVCRVAATTPSPHPSNCVAVTRLPVQPGPTHVEVALSADLTIDPPELLAYRVRILNAHGRSAGFSPEAFAASGVAPQPIDQLSATPTRDGAVLQWQQKDTSAAVELDRLIVGPNGVVLTEPAQHKVATKSSSRPAIRKQPAVSQKPVAGTPPKPLLTNSPAPVEVRLRTPPQSTDAGGTIDHTAQSGETYRYTAQRVRTVTLAGHTLELRSIVSSPVTVVMRSIFPPHAPSGLEAVPGGATAADRSIDLSWSPNTEDDLAGYIVYRQEIDLKGVAAGTATRLNPIPVVGPAFRDQTAITGHRYAYYVTAVDTAGNESAPGDTVQETLREQ